MMGRRVFAAGLMGCFAGASAASAQVPASWMPGPIEHRGFDWRLVARSDLIVRGILTSAEALAVSRIYKGSERRTDLELRYADCATAAATLAALKARDGVFCLARPDTGSAYHLTACRTEAAALFGANHEAALQTEIDIQRATVRRVETSLANDRLPFEASVEAAIRAALAGDNQSALRGLQRSGLPAAPAMVRSLEDRRRLPRKDVTAASDRHRVGDVGDLLMLALGLLVKDARFGFPSPETPDGQRLRMADAWRVWLGYSLGLAG
jgi:hypothetical protein